MLDRVEIEEWAGHRPATRSALMDVLTKAYGSAASLSRAECVLFTACEFWAAVRNDTLHLYLARKPEAQLLAVEDSFAAMGMMRVAQIVRVARLELATLGRPIGLQHVLADLPVKLEESAERVDAGIETFALEALGQRSDATQATG